jgi:hypothetical protein
VACPFFYPTNRHDGELWPFRRRLPLGDGFYGHCTAPGHEGSIPDEGSVRDSCNLGYANCPRLPQERAADAVHFSVASDRDGIISLRWVVVKNHAAADFGKLDFERVAFAWRTPHPNPTLQRMAQCYLESYLTRRGELQPSGASQ